MSDYPGAVGMRLMFDSPEIVFINDHPAKITASMFNDIGEDIYFLVTLYRGTESQWMHYSEVKKDAPTH